MQTKPKLVDRRLRWFLFCFLLSVYLLVYVPEPDSADGNAVLAAASAFLHYGTPDISAIAADDARFEFDMSRMGTFGVDGALYSKKGVAPSIALLPFIFAAQILPWLTMRATAMLLNALLTAASGVLLYKLVRVTGFRPRVALGVSLIYGLATLALVYTKTLFGEPLAALALLAATLCVLSWREQGARRWLLLAGAALGVALGVNMTYALMPFVFAAFVFTPRSVAAAIRSHQSRRILMDAAAFAAPVLLALAGLALYNWARFGSPLNTGYHFEAGEGFTRPILAGLFGLFLSPYRGLLWFSPIVLLALPGWWMLRRRLPLAAWLTLAVVSAQSLTYAGWWSWHGGVVWGTRFLVPVVPLMAFWLAPLVDRLFDAGGIRRLGLSAVFGVLLPVSLIVQALGALFSPYPYYGELVANHYTGVIDSLVTGLGDEVMYDPRLSPVLGHARMLFEGQPLSPAWLRDGVDVVYLATALLLMGAAFALLRQRRPALIGVGMCLIALNVVAARQIEEPHTQAMMRLEQTMQTATVTVLATDYYEDAVLDAERIRPMTMNAPVAQDDRLERPLWEHALQTDRRLWYVTWFTAQDPDNWQERELWKTGAFAYEHVLDGHRALLFYLTPPTSVQQPENASFGPFQLDAYGASAVEDGIIVELHWQAVDAPDADYAWFVHLLSARGEIVAQQDRPPLGGTAPTSTWASGDQVVDRLYFPIEAAAVGAGWKLRVGWIDPSSGERLATLAPDGTPIDEGFVMLPLEPASGG
ncbi:MAG: phospholipid carrier-dependent glycosyltransferase [Anaerolineae bacterium]|nr:phospholipid carrier-dependent glycosyltransferase [Anaerolineae bacterium]